MAEATGEGGHFQYSGQGGAGVDVLLVYPSYETILDRRGRFLTTIPLGMGYLASALESKGFSVRVLDLTIKRGWSIEDITSHIMKASPRILCLSLTSMGLHQAYLILQELRRGGFSCTVVVGGPHVTAEPSIVTDIGADYGITGEAEHSLPKLCRDLLQGSGRLENVRGLIQKRGDNPPLTNPPESITDLDDLPFPARHLFETRVYNYTSIITSRGCPFECSYCTTARTFFRQRSLENVLKEVECVVEQINPDSISFVDNVFTLKRDFVVDFCRRVSSMFPSLRWTCATRADLADDELISQMASSGCDRISFGVESGREGLRFMLGKRIPDKKYENAFRSCRKAGIKTSAYFMIGHPGETRTDINASVDFALKLDPDDVFFTPTIILPKTRLREYCLQKGLTSKDAWINFMKGVSDVPYVIPEEFKAYGVDTLQLYAMRNYFLNTTHIGRRVSRIRSLNELTSSSKLIAGVLVDKVFIRQDIIPYDI